MPERKDAALKFIAPVALAAVLALNLIIIRGLGDVRAGLEFILRQEAKTMQTLETNVTGQSGLVTLVRTERRVIDGVDEPAASWQARHQEGIDVALLF